MKPGIQLLVLSLAACALLYSCAHTGDTLAPVRDFRSLSLEQLELLSQQDPEACLETISALCSELGEETGLEPAWAALEQKALENLVGRLAREEAAGAWKQAELSLSSLEAASRVLANNHFLENYFAGENTALEATRLRLLKKRSQEYLDRGLYAPGVNYLHKFLELLPESSGIVQAGPHASFVVTWLEQSLQRGDKPTAERLSALLGTTVPDQILKEDDSQDRQVADQAAELSKASLAELAEAVVTVNVDKGLKIQRGLGYPDRVLGSAFQLDDLGYYLTNYHVIASEVDPEYEGYSSLSIRPFDKPEARIPASVLGWNEELDLAILKSEAAQRTLYLHAVDDPAKGQRVYSIGSPVGLESSVSSGIISAPGRRILARGDALQIDVPVNPGSSGGPLLDEEGRIVGLIFAGLSDFQGLNFALPSSWISSILPLLFEGGRIELPWLGLGMARTMDGFLELSYVFPWRQSLKPGDRILSIDGVPVRELSDAQRLLTEKPLASLCALQIKRGEKELNLLAKTQAMPKSPMARAAKSESPEELLQGMTGMLLLHVVGPRGPGGSYRILKLWPGLPGDESGLREGDLIKFVRYRHVSAEGMAAFDLSVKSPASGYLEKTMRLVLSLEMNNFL
ncbi:MAG: trypsin-like peptidase domain-containing protein [Spirochaetia bacterium]|nr:trypsin-like peptidase domain-containing protein [Spirochaetia bacterium]